MLLSKSCVYALRASVYLASKEGSGYVTIKELSDELGISFHFLTKVLQQLTKNQILKSYQGPNGGVKLAKPASEVLFNEIVVSIDGSHLLKECALGLPGCGELKPCPLHDQWSGFRTRLQELMRDVSIAEMAARGSTNRVADIDSGKREKLL